MVWGFTAMGFFGFSRFRVVGFCRFTPLGILGWLSSEVAGL